MSMYLRQSASPPVDMGAEEGMSQTGRCSGAPVCVTVHALGSASSMVRVTTYCPIHGGKRA